MTRRLLNWLPAILLMALIFLASSIPGKVIRDTGFDKELLHINAHFFLFFMLFVGYFKATKSLDVSLVMQFLYAVFDEYHQKYVPLRSASMNDIAVDLIAGVVAGLIIWKLLRGPSTKLKKWLIN